jgi:hypothetical protein
VLQLRKSASSPVQPSISTVTAATRTGPHSISKLDITCTGRNCRSHHVNINGWLQLKPNGPKPSTERKRTANKPISGPCISNKLGNARAQLNCIHQLVWIGKTLSSRIRWIVRIWNRVAQPSANSRLPRHFRFVTIRIWTVADVFRQRCSM